MEYFMLFMLAIPIFFISMFIIGACQCDNAYEDWVRIREKEKYDCIGQLEPKNVNEILFTLNEMYKVLCKSKDSIIIQQLFDHFYGDIYTTELYNCKELYFILNDWDSRYLPTDYKITDNRSVSYPNLLFDIERYYANNKIIIHDRIRNMLIDLNSDNCPTLDNNHILKTKKEFCTYLSNTNDLTYYNIYISHFKDKIKNIAKM